MSIPVLRSATPADVDAVLALWRLAAEGTDRVDTREAAETLIARDPDAPQPQWSRWVKTLGATA